MIYTLIALKIWFSVTYRVCMTRRRMMTRVYTRKMMTETICIRNISRETMKKCAHEVRAAGIRRSRVIANS